MENDDVEVQLHPAVTAILKYFGCGHLPEELQQIVRPCRILAHTMAYNSPQNAELTVGLRKLLEAKDCFVRAQI